MSLDPTGSVGRVEVRLDRSERLGFMPACVCQRDLMDSEVEVGVDVEWVGCF